MRRNPLTYVCPGAARSSRPRARAGTCRGSSSPARSPGNRGPGGRAPHGDCSRSRTRVDDCRADPFRGHPGSRLVTGQVRLVSRRRRAKAPPWPRNTARASRAAAPSGPRPRRPRASTDRPALHLGAAADDDRDAARAPRRGSPPRSTRGTTTTSVSYATRIAAGSDATPSSPNRSADAGAPLGQTGAARYCLRYGRPIGGGRDRAADDAGDGDQCEHVGQRAEEQRRRAALREVRGQAVAERAREAEQQAAAYAPNGRQLPKISAAMAMKPRPPVRFWSKSAHVGRPRGTRRRAPRARRT